MFGNLIAKSKSNATTARDSAVNRPVPERPVLSVPSIIVTGAEHAQIDPAEFCATGQQGGPKGSEIVGRAQSRQDAARGIEAPRRPQQGLLRAPGPALPELDVRTKLRLEIAADEKQSVLHQAVINFSNKVITLDEFKQILCSEEKLLEEKDSFGRTPLRYAVILFAHEAAMALTHAGSDVDAVDQSGEPIKVLLDRIFERPSQV